MRSGSPVFRRGVALLILVCALAVPVASASDTVPAPPPPPEARIGVPIGVTAADEPPAVLDLFFLWLQARIGVLIG
ncbi:MAG TPA: hypothetical protein VEO54_03455 [Thermoanaerobaculia bacterium]|nr:hypothetical protein [Thermoanaerobaculia bacterium]